MSRPRAGLIVAALVLASGCQSKPLQKLDGSSGGIGAIDATGGPSGDGGVTDTGGGAPPWDVTFAGRQSFVVTSAVPMDGGATSGTSHSFTMTLDTDRRVAILGTNGSVDVFPVEQTAPGVLRFGGQLQFGVPVTVACGGVLSYDDLHFTIAPAGRLSGAGQGVLTTYAGTDNGNSVPVTTVVTGVPDIEPPTFSLASGGDLADPWQAFWVISSEPLPGQQMRPVLRSAGGDVVAFEAPTGMEEFVATMAKPSRLLRYGEQYQVTFDGITDLAGHAPGPTAALAFTTRTAPPLVSADGFESVTDATLGGAEVLSGAGAPTIEGARSLYVPPVALLARSGWVTQFALRLPIAPGNTVLHFDYRAVNPTDIRDLYFVIASVGGTIGTAVLPSDDGVATTPAMIGQTRVSLGPTMTATLGLPGDAHGEVVVARIAAQFTSCGGLTSPAVPGLIIDNLRAE